MSGFELVARLVEATAWPAILVAALVVLRGPLGRLIDRTGEVEVPGAKWRESAQETAAALAAVRSVSVQGEETVTPQLAGLASSDAGAAIGQAYEKLTAVLRTKLATATGETPSAGTPAPDLAHKAVAAGVLSVKTERAVEGVAVMRNLVNTNRGPITTQEALEFIALAEATAYAAEADTGRQGALQRRMRESTTE